MSRKFSMPSAGRIVVAAAAAGALALASATPAFAHNEVSASDARALATDVTLTFEAAAESTTAGITSLRVVLPQGIVPSDVTYLGGPNGWTYKPADDGYTVGGTALAPGADAEYKVKVRQLPDTNVLVFKTLQEYSDGRIDRWIDPPKTGDDHSNAAAKPAPSLALQKAAPGAVAVPATPTAAPTTAPAPSSAAPPAATTPPAAPSTVAAPTVGPTPTDQSFFADKDDDDSSALPIVLGIVGAVVVVGGAGGAWWWRRRSAS